MSSSRALCKKMHDPLRMLNTQDAVHAYGSTVRRRLEYVIGSVEMYEL